MAELFNIYCDESCHLIADGIQFMSLGCVWCSAARTPEISRRIREIKGKHGLLKTSNLPNSGVPLFEIKWTKVSLAKIDFYKEITDYFFDNDDLHFRAALIDKQQLRHDLHSQTHDEWYYKMLFRVLEPIIDPEKAYSVYLDIKDTQSEIKRKQLEQVIRNVRHDHTRTILQRIQQIRSNESEIMQIADLLLGALTYHNRIKSGNLPAPSLQQNGKLQLVARIRQRSQKSLEATTWLRESKFNILRWQPRETGQ